MTPGGRSQQRFLDRPPGQELWTCFDGCHNLTCLSRRQALLWGKICKNFTQFAVPILTMSSHAGVLNRWSPVPRIPTGWKPLRRYLQSDAAKHCHRYFLTDFGCHVLACTLSIMRIGNSVDGLTRLLNCRPSISMLGKSWSDHLIRHSWCTTCHTWLLITRACNSARKKPNRLTDSHQISRPCLKCGESPGTSWYYTLTAFPGLPPFLIQ